VGANTGLRTVTNTASRMKYAVLKIKKQCAGQKKSIVGGRIMKKGATTMEKINELVESIKIIAEQVQELIEVMKEIEIRQSIIEKNYLKGGKDE